MYSYLAGLGIGFIAEDVTNKGRIDITITTVVEFKIIEDVKDKNNALAQIKAKQYADKYQAMGASRYLVGVDFCKQDKNVCCFEWQQLDQ